MKRGMKNDLEPFVLVILVAITVIEFLIFAGGIKYDEFIEALNAMITLMIFGAMLLVISIITRMYDLNRNFFTLFSDMQINANSSASQKQTKTKTTNKAKTTKKASKKKKRR